MMKMSKGLDLANSTLYFYAYLPYRTFSSFLREHFGQRVQKITLDAGLSCPHRDADKNGGCIYCNALGSGTGAAAKGTGLKEQIETQIAFQSKRYKARSFIAYYQSYSNTYAPLDELKRIYDSVLPYPEIAGISIGTRPDCITDEILDLIGSYSDKRLVWIEYGLQSSNDETLRLINRGHDSRAFSKAATMAHEHGLRVCAHVILGLPGEGEADWLKTARFVANLPVTDIKIHLMYVVRDTPLEKMFKDGIYKPLLLEDYAQGVARFIACLPPEMVIQRITGDPHPDELIAPSWALEKKKVLDKIHETINKMGLFQGKNFLGC
jgi:radical SAM protein (TIGR01212 family)